MDASEHRSGGGTGTGTAAEAWLQAQLNAHADEFVVMPPDFARIDARHHGIRRRRAALVACAASVLTVSTMMAAVALTGGGGEAEVTTPPTLLVPTPSAETAPATPAPSTSAPATIPSTTEPPRPAPTGTGGTAPPSSGAPNPTGTAAPTGGTATTRAPARPGGGSGDPSTPGTSGTSTTSGGNGTAACTDKNVRISMSTTEDSSNHVLLTATNIGATSCTLYYHPQVVLGDRHPTPPMESPAKALATIAPGQKAYAGVRLWNDGDTPPEHPVKSFAVNLQGRVANTPAGHPIDVQVPREIIALDVGTNPLSTLWNTDVDAVNRYLYAR
ncbi:DUF4232 domain-containing protein [Streptodolium elevatio]|uniref:DUF4232 domain-containing protein n=1 Tax=Streptodolium elevatio TaxID=3157996 RepID=A0ABV3DCJ7_9ACTN